jgi:hypothetical protein
MLFPKAFITEVDEKSMKQWGQMFSIITLSIPALCGNK